MKKSESVRFLIAASVLFPVILHILVGNQIAFLNLGTEVSLGMVVSAGLFAAIAAVFGWLAWVKQDWLVGVVAVIFAFLAFDDAFAIHEWLAEHVIGPWAVGIVSDEYRYAWLVVYIPAALLVAGMVTVIVRRYLRRPWAFVGVGAGVAAALLLELGEAKGWLAWPDLWRAGLEEGVELATVALFLYALLSNLLPPVGQRMIRAKK